MVLKKRLRIRLAMSHRLKIYSVYVAAHIMHTFQNDHKPNLLLCDLVL